MRKYREKALPAEVAQQSTLPSAGRSVDMGHQGVPQYAGLAAQYGLDDMEIGTSDTTQQTIEEEYRMYTMAPNSPLSVSIIKFWEVRRTQRTMIYY